MAKCNYPHCDNEVPAGRRVYCSDKCAKNAYVYNRYHKDKSYKEYIRSKSYDVCPLCGGKKHKQSMICRKCYNKYHLLHVDTDEIMKYIEMGIDDKDSLFYDDGAEELIWTGIE